METRWKQKKTATFAKLNPAKHVNFSNKMFGQERKKGTEKNA